MARSRGNSAGTFLVTLIRYIAPLLVLGAAVAIAVTLWMLPGKPLPSKPKPPPTAAATVAIEPHLAGFEINVNGKVIPFRDVVLASEVAGKIETKDPVCKAGKPVAGNQSLLKIDSYNYQFDVDRLVEEKAQAAAALLELQTELEGKEKEVPFVEREVKLRVAEYNRQNEVGNFLTPSELESYEQLVVAAQNKLLALNNQITLLKARKTSLTSRQKLAELQHNKAVRDLGKTEIKSPFDAVIITDHVEEGAYVQIGSPLVTLEDTSTAEVLCHLRVEQLRWILGQPAVRDADLSAYKLPPLDCDVVLNIGGDEYLWKGKLDRYQGMGLDPRTRTAPCIVKVANPKQVEAIDSSAAELGPPALVREMFVTVNIKINPPSSVRLYRAPDKAVRPGGVVLLQTDDGMESVRVSVAQAVGGEVIVRPIAGDLKAGDRAIISPVDLEKL